VCMPLDTRAILLTCITHSCPFARADAHCPFQLSLLSMMTPRNLVVSFDGMCWFLRTSVLRGIGIFFLGFIGFGTSLFVMSRSWNFSMLNSQLHIFAHLKMLSLQFMMFRSFSCVSLKSLPVTMTAVLSMKSSIRSPVLRSGIFSKSMLYMRYDIPECGSPWFKPLSMMKALVCQSSKMRVVLLFSSHLLIHSVCSFGMPRLLMLCISHSMLMLEKAPFTSRKRVEATCPFLQASFTVFVSRCTESVVVRPGLAPKWFAGSMLCFSHIVTISSTWQLLSSLAGSPLFYGYTWLSPGIPI
jgi:hypothetical protein